MALPDLPSEPAIPRPYGRVAAESARADQGCIKPGNFIRFLAFGLTVRAGGPTVTVRNRHFQL